MGFRYLLLVLSSLTISNAFSQYKISNSPLEQIVPSETLPEGVVTQNSNNNLDIFKYKNRYYVGFRTAPSHFASWITGQLGKTNIYMTRLKFEKDKAEIRSSEDIGPFEFSKPEGQF
ncbi:MAG: hypothetical protein GY810_04905 [Aureispira sp.]|nr:hypothetical protein [Aureispira sp.]